MDLEELELSGGILRVSRNASALTALAGTFMFITIPQTGVITYMSSGLIFSIVLYFCYNAILQHKFMNQIVDNTDCPNIRKIRSMISELNDEKLNDLQKYNICFSAMTLIASIAMALRSGRLVESPFLNILSALSFFGSSALYGKVAVMYQQLMEEVGVEGKILTKTNNINRGPEF